MNRGSILLWSWIRDSEDWTGFKHVTFRYASEIDKWICLMGSLVLRYFILSNLVCPRLSTIEDETSHCFREGQTKFRTEISTGLVFKIDHLKKKWGDLLGSPMVKMGFLAGSTVKNPCLCRCGFDPWLRKISWRRKWQPTPIFLSGKSHGQRSLVGYSPQGCKSRIWLSD